MAQSIKRFEIKKKGKILIELNRSSASSNSAGIVNKNEKIISDLMPHGDLLRAIEKMMPHLLVAQELVEPTFKVIDKDYPMNKEWFDKFHYSDDPRFAGVTLTGLIVVGKEVADGIYLLGTKETIHGGLSKLKTPLISLLKSAEGEYEYPLLKVIDAQFETLVTELLEFHNELKYAPDPQQRLWEENTSTGGKLKKVS